MLFRSQVERLIQILPKECSFLHSIPVSVERPTPRLLPLFAAKAARVVYLSTTGVYGAAHWVDETTLAAPRTQRQRLRVDEESGVASGSWLWCLLRPAAIYGPGRGVHRALIEGRHRVMGDGSNYVSRIHVDDLAAIADAALMSDITGTFPVADDEPSTSAEIARFCAELLGIEAPATGGELPADDTRSANRSANRRVDGRLIRELLGVKLRYPSYRVGIPACLEAESLTDRLPS